MRVRYQDFDPASFSFHNDGVLVLDDFWTPEETDEFRANMHAATPWTSLAEMPDVQRTFVNCGNWTKADLDPASRQYLIERTLLPCVQSYISSFEPIVKGVMSFHYYNYAVGDSLSIHRDVDSGDTSDPCRQRIKRRVALTTYLHEHWEPDWGGELLLYEDSKANLGELDVVDCIAPRPGSLVMFTVPRTHRVCRVDPLAGDARRLSVAGWFMTEH